jgi:hypothetical protein
VSFNGSANINLPGVNTAGNQNTTGNAATATALQTARTINNTSFNGSANITTARWGTARTLTVGNTGKSVNGSGNVSWTLAEIGAAPAASAIPAGTVMLFRQTAAPTGWTKDTTNFNEHALRVVTGTAGSGGSVNFTSAFASKGVSGSVGSTTATNQNTTAGGTVAAHTLTVAQIPSHGHRVRSTGSRGNGYGEAGYNTFGVNTEFTGGGGSHTHGFTGTAHTHTQNAHTHTFTGTAINLAVRYVDVIFATKN